MRERIPPDEYSHGRGEIAHARLASCQASVTLSWQWKQEPRQPAAPHRWLGRYEQENPSGQSHPWNLLAEDECSGTSYSTAMTNGEQAGRVGGMSSSQG